MKIHFKQQCGEPQVEVEFIYEIWVEREDDSSCNVFCAEYDSHSPDIELTGEDKVHADETADKECLARFNPRNMPLPYESPTRFY